MERVIEAAAALELARGAERLVEAVHDVDGRHGGLMTRETIRTADELRVLIWRYRRQFSYTRTR